MVTQELTDFELLVRDDFSSEDVKSIVSEFADPRMRLVRNTKNIGMAATNRLLYDDALGKYTAHLDDDDEWAPNFLSELVSALEANSDIDLAFANHTVVDAAGFELPELTAQGREKWGRAHLPEGRHPEGRRIVVLKRAVPASHSAVIRRSAISSLGFAVEADLAWDFWVSVAGVRRTGVVWFDPRPLSFYRVHLNQSSSIVRRGAPSDSTFDGLVWCWERVLQDPAFGAEAQELRPQVALERAKWALSMTRDGHARDATMMARAAVGLAPTPMVRAVDMAVRLNAAIPGQLGRRAIDQAVRIRFRWRRT